jgi:hypothetical protein
MTKPEVPWQKLPRSTKLASILYPDHCDEETKRQMQEICDANKKRSPMQRFEKKS